MKKPAPLVLGLAKLFDLLAREQGLPTVPDSVRWGSPIARPGKLIGIGLNYSDHAAEAGLSIPTEPIVFLKGANTVCGAYDPIIIPRNSQKTDWEVEAAIN